jgi:hypothetical protein
MMAVLTSLQMKKNFCTINLLENAILKWHKIGKFMSY